MLDYWSLCFPELLGRKAVSLSYWHLEHCGALGLISLVVSCSVFTLVLVPGTSAQLFCLLAEVPGPSFLLVGVDLSYSAWLAETSSGVPVLSLLVCAELVESTWPTEAESEVLSLSSPSANAVADVSVLACRAAVIPGLSFLLFIGNAELPLCSGCQPLAFLSVIYFIFFLAITNSGCLFCGLLVS